MKNPNNSAMFLPRDQVFRWTNLSPEAKLVHLQEQINQIAWETEAKIGGQKKAGTRHNLALNTGFRVVTAGVPDGWTSAGAGVTFSQQAVRPGGDTRNYSARIAAGAGAAGTLTQTVPVFPGQRMSMAVWVKVTTGSGYISLSTNGTNPHTNKVKFSSTDGTGGFIALPSLKLTAPMVEIPTDATTVTITLSADISSTIDFCEVQYGHGTQRVPHLWVDSTGDALPNGGSASQLKSGVWSATVADVANTSVRTAAEGQYLRVGNTVTASVILTIDAILAAQTTVSITLPVSSNFGAVSDCAGTGNSPDVASASGAVYADAASDLAYFSFVASAAMLNQMNWCLTFTYQVI